MLWQRLTLAAALIAPILGVCWLDWHWGFRQPVVWLPPAVGLALVCAAEMLHLLAAKNWRPAPGPVYAGVLLIVLSAFAPLLWERYPPDCPLGRLGWPLLALAAATVGVWVVEMRRFEQPGAAVVNVALSVLILVYVGVLMGLLAGLRMLPLGNDPAWGMAALFSAIFVAKMCDSGGFLAGRLLGRVPLAPVLSPTKTVEGAVGGVALAVLAAWLLLEVLAPRFIAEAPPRPWWSWVGFGLIVAVAAMVGDLAESLLKRDLEQKDSGAWIPAFGGALDVLDSILLAAPAAYLCWVAGLVGPG